MTRTVFLQVQPKSSARVSKSPKVAVVERNSVHFAFEPNFLRQIILLLNTRNAISMSMESLLAWRNLWQPRLVSLSRTFKAEVKSDSRGVEKLQWDAVSRRLQIEGRRSQFTTYKRPSAVGNSVEIRITSLINQISSFGLDPVVLISSPFPVHQHCLGEARNALGSIIVPVPGQVTRYRPFRV